MIDSKETISVSNFKATCLSVLERVRRTGRSVTVTKFGEPIAEVIPHTPPAPTESWLGCLRETGRIVGDVVSSASDEDEWEVLKP